MEALPTAIKVQEVESVFDLAAGMQVKVLESHIRTLGFSSQSSLQFPGIWKLTQKSKLAFSVLLNYLKERRIHFPCSHQATHLFKAFQLTQHFPVHNEMQSSQP